MKLDVNTKANIVLTAKLEKLHRSAFPSAVRNTLNNLAFDMKQKEIPNSFKSNFKPKSGTLPYVRKMIRVEKASGFNVNSMSAVVGLLNPSSKLDRRFVEGLEKQETGGVIDDGLRYLKDARGGKLGGRVRRENYYDKSKVISGRSKAGRSKGTRKSKFVARAFRALKENKPMFMNSMRGNYLVSVKSINKSNEGKLNIQFRFLAMDRETKKTNLRATQFVDEARQKTVQKIELFYRKNAEYQFKKYLK